MKETLRLRGRGGIQRLDQGLPAAFILADNSGPVPLVGVNLHQQTVGLFLGLVLGQDQSTGFPCALRIVGFQVQLGQPEAGLVEKRV